MEKKKLGNVSTPIKHFTPKGEFILNQLELSGTECCGWVLVSRFYSSYDRAVNSYNHNSAKEDLKNLSNGGIEFVLDDQWEDEDDEELLSGQFPLFAVLAGEQTDIFGPLMDELGWQRWPSFRNPNTDNICTPFIFIPSNCKVS